MVKSEKYKFLLKDLYKNYGLNDFDTYQKKYFQLKNEYSIQNRWDSYTLFIDHCLELNQLDVAIKEWNLLMEEEWEGWNMRWSYHCFHVPYLLKFEFMTKRSVVTGQNVYRMSGWKNLTKFGVENIEEIKSSIDKLIIKQGSFFNLIWSEYNFDINYVNSTQLKKDVGMNSNSLCQMCNEVAEELGRKGENYFRKNSGLPKIGEGWVSETDLFYKIKESLSCEVIQHGKPKWLGRQHFDIWIPSLNVAIEYQGLQHDKPVKFFGGEKAFKDNQRRDLRKKKLCVENCVTLIEVRKDYDINDVLNKIKNS